MIKHKTYNTYNCVVVESQLKFIKLLFQFIVNRKGKKKRQSTKRLPFCLYTYLVHILVGCMHNNARVRPDIQQIKKIYIKQQQQNTDLFEEIRRDRRAKFHFSLFLSLSLVCYLSILFIFYVLFDFFLQF